MFLRFHCGGKKLRIRPKKSSVICVPVTSIQTRKTAVTFYPLWTFLREFILPNQLSKGKGSPLNIKWTNLAGIRGIKRFVKLCWFCEIRAASADIYEPLLKRYRYLLVLLKTKKNFEWKYQGFMYVVIKSVGALKTYFWTVLSVNTNHDHSKSFHKLGTNFIQHGRNPEKTLRSKWTTVCIPYPVIIMPTWLEYQNRDVRLLYLQDPLWKWLRCKHINRTHEYAARSVFSLGKT